MTQTINLNAVATQLAIDADYYEQKAHECWEILNSIDGSVITDPNQLTFTVTVGNKGMTALPVHLSDIITINEVFFSLLKYYRGKYAKAQQQLNAIKCGSTISSPF